MRAFFDRLWRRGEGTLAAPRAVRLERLDRSRAAYSGSGAPSTWGAFVLDGDWR
jgi:hypothetical protein